MGSFEEDCCADLELITGLDVSAGTSIAQLLYTIAPAFSARLFRWRSKTLKEMHVYAPYG